MLLCGLLAPARGGRERRLPAGGQAHDEEENRFLNELTEAYVMLARADRARDQDDRAAALEAYEDALALYRRLYNIYPGRQTDIIQYRMAYCANQAETLRQRAKGGPAPAPVTREDESEARYREKYLVLLEENQYLHEQLLKMERPASIEQKNFEQLEASLEREWAGQLEAAKAEADQIRKDLEQQVSEAVQLAARLQQERDAATVERADLEQKLAKLEGTHRNTMERLEKLERQREQEQAAAVELRDRLEKERDVLGAKLAELERQAQEAAEALRQEQVGATVRWEKLEAERKALEEKVAQMEKARQNMLADLESWKNRHGKESAAARELRAQVELERRARDDLAGQVQQAQTELEKLRADRDKEMAAGESAREALAAEQSGRRVLQNRLAELEKQLRQLAHERDRLQQEVRSLHSELARRPPLPSEGDIFEPVPSWREQPVRPTLEAFRPAPRDLMNAALDAEKNGRHEQALSLYAAAAEQQFGSVRALKGQGRCLLRLGRPAEAAAVLRTAVEQAADDLEARLLLGISLCGTQDYREAVEVLRVAVLAAPDHAVVRNALGAAWMGLGNRSAAQAELEKAVSLDPKLADAQLNLSAVLATGSPEDRPAARRHYEIALELGAAPDPHIEAWLSYP